MNLEQLKAILWLRWRLSVNQWRKAGDFNFILMMILVCSALVVAASAFFVAIVLGIFLLPKATPMTVMITWDVIIGILFFCWSISLLVEIQRTELLSLEKLLHLPMSLRDAFVLNYLSSLICLNIVCFFPAAIGLCVAMAITFGPKMLILIPMVLSFILMLTAVTYQFRGWVASLMSNKRRQRTIITFFTFGFIALSQVPNVVIQLTVPRASQTEQSRLQQHAVESKALSDAFSRQEITKQEYDQGLAKLKEDFKQKRRDAQQASQMVIDKYLTLANQVLPVGWLPYASKSLLLGSLWPAALCLLGMTLIGTASLRRSYSSTIKYYTGNSFAAAPTKSPIKLQGQEAQSDKPTFMERKLPGLSEHASAITFCSFKNLVRAPEAKMLLIGPMILGIMFVLMLFTNRTPKIPDGIEPLVWLAGIAILTFMCLMLILNMFGMDRSGFRCFILMPAKRSDILLGKNFSMLPIVGSIGILVACGLFYLAPLGPLSIVACVCQMLISFTMASVVGNWVSIQFPFAMVPGTGKPAQLSLVTMLVQMLAMLTSPLYLVPGILFYGIEWALRYFFSIEYLPIFALMSVIELWLVYKLYSYVLIRQGNLLQIRETRILEILTANSE